MPSFPYISLLSAKLFKNFNKDLSLLLFGNRLTHFVNRIGDFIIEQFCSGAVLASIESLDNLSAHAVCCDQLIGVSG